MVDPNSPSVQPGLEPLLKTERDLILKRREAACEQPGDPARDAIGVALSGGGIRSATFCLGLFQALANRALIRRLDYLSTVSGGGYFGCFVGRMFTRDWTRHPTGGEGEPAGGYLPAHNLRSHRPQVADSFLNSLKAETRPLTVDRVEAVLKDNAAPPLRWLRESGNYLTPNGSGDSAFAAAVFTRNWLTLLIVMLVSLVTIFLGGNLLRAVLDAWSLFHRYELLLQSLTREHWWWTPWFFVPWLVMAVAVGPVAWAYWLSQAGDPRQFAYVAGANLMVIGFGVFAWRLLGESNFYLGAMVIGVEALFALAWIFVMGWARCRSFRSSHSLLPDARLRMSILLVSLLPLVWRELLRLESRNPLIHPAIWASVLVLIVSDAHHLALRAAVEQPSKIPARGWFGCWDLAVWWKRWPGMFCWLAVMSLPPLILTIWSDWPKAHSSISKLLDVWEVLSLLAAPYFLAYQVLLADAKIDATGAIRPDLTAWLRSKLSHYLYYGLLVYGALQVLVIVNTLGQSLYAAVTYAGGAKFAGKAISGLLCTASLAPLIRAVAVRAFGVKEGWRIPLKIMAIIAALILSLLLALSLSYVSQGIAWRWACPKFVKEADPDLPATFQVTGGDLTDVGSLLQKLRANNPVSIFLANQISLDGNHWALTNPDASLERVKAALTRALNEILESRCFYDPKRFAGVTLSGAASRRMPEYPGAEFGRPTRLFLQDAYPGEIAEVKERETLWSRIKDGWSPSQGTKAAKAAGDSGTDRKTLANSPGAMIYKQYEPQRDVSLNDENLVQVLPPPAATESFKKQTHMFIIDLGLSFFAGLALTWFFGRTISFLNLSSFHSFYTSRLIRAYQGASNASRWRRANGSIDKIDGRDDIAWHNYRPHRYGGPLHLVNSTINSTVSLETNKQSTTALGLNLCMGPAGLSFGHRHALSSTESNPERNILPGSRVLFADFLSENAPSREIRFVPRTLEPLSLGEWVGISGAAFSTGLGNVGGGGGTALGTSLLCGLFNVRLGYWWRNDFSPSTGRSGDYYLPTQTYLMDELTGRFHIENRDRWYLSDGGHFENTGAYELIRRQVPFILILDCGADPEGGFDDLANLVRRVRLDFGAEIEFMGDEELAEKVHEELLAPCVNWRLGSGGSKGKGSDEPEAKAGRIGRLTDLRPYVRGKNGFRGVRAHATLGRVRHGASEGVRMQSFLLIVKPGITPDLPPDLLNFQRTNPEFPQQSTLDQFFDEAQWESYRKLGEYVANLLFAVPEDPYGKWWPGQMAM